MIYTPSHSELDGKYRKISVRVKNPELTVVARQGYFARETRALAVAESAPRELDAGAGAPSTDGPIPPDQVNITTYILPVEIGIKELEVPIAVALPLHLLTSDKQPDLPSTLKVTIHDSSGKTVGTFTGQVDKQNFYLVRGVTLAPGRYLVELSLEQGGKELYKASTAMDVPANLGARFGLSNIVPLFPPSPGAGSDGNTMGNIRPTSSLRSGENLLVHFRVFPGTRSEPSRFARVLYVFYKDGQELGRHTHPEVLDLSESPASGFPVLAELATGQLNPGAYRIEVQVLDSRLGRRATSELEITIIPGNK